MKKKEKPEELRIQLGRKALRFRRSIVGWIGPLGPKDGPTFRLEKLGREGGAALWIAWRDRRIVGQGESLAQAYLAGRDSFEKARLLGELAEAAQALLGRSPR